MAEGHGRAADIWSLSCVVIEMATGRRPWAQLESNYQIMFKVTIEMATGWRPWAQLESNYQIMFKVTTNYRDGHRAETLGPAGE